MLRPRMLEFFVEILNNFLNVCCFKKFGAENIPLLTERLVFIERNELFAHNIIVVNGGFKL